MKMRRRVSQRKLKSRLKRKRDAARAKTTAAKPKKKPSAKE